MNFNDALEKATQLAQARLHELTEHVFLVRDLHGRIRLLLKKRRDQNSPFYTHVQALIVDITRALGIYAYPADDLVIYREELKALLLPDDSVSTILAKVGDYKVCLHDRLLMGTEWSDPPADLATTSKRFTLFSMKGGVGRSTTAAILAHHLASKGKRVLVFDLDLESPGIGSTLLGDGLPQFGVVDWFVEDALGQGDAVVEYLHAESPLATTGGGQITVVPAFGSGTGDYLAKLGRTYLERGPTGPEPWTKRLGRFVSKVEQRFNPDVVLLDSRTGLHDTSAAAVLALGADTLMFALDTPQTWAAYRFLFQHWNRHPQIRQFRDRLRVIASSVPSETGADYLNKFRDHAHELFQDTLYDEAGDADAPVDPLAPPAFSYAPRDEGAPHCATHITWHPGLTAFAPLEQFNQGAVTAAYTDFLGWFDDTWPLEAP